MTAARPPVNLLELNPGELKAFLRQLEESPAYADQILKGIYRHCLSDFEAMALPEALKQKLAQQTTLGILEPLEERLSSDGQTRKVLFGLKNGHSVESTLMFYRNSVSGRARHTVCVSSQVGCPVGCFFCATGQQGFERNLSQGEIMGQILYFIRAFRPDTADIQAAGSRGWLTNVVFMGMGEPLANYSNVTQAIAMLNSPKGMGLGVRQVTLSTAGLVPEIIRLAREDLLFQLAVSLHAATDVLRDRLVPINRKYPLGQLIPGCKEYAGLTGRKIFIEYALFSGINDALDQADELARLVEGLPCSINLILGNPTTSGEYIPSSLETAHQFQQKLISGGIRTMLRVSRGADIEAGCGQLRSRRLKGLPLPPGKDEHDVTQRQAHD
jgi:23S rRNA (adenine2503-C2)-methyltransferase